jgi:hypothetical protein
MLAQRGAGGEPTRNGPADHWIDTGKTAAVIRSREQRYGCRVVGVATSPPTTTTHQN